MASDSRDRVFGIRDAAVARAQVNNLRQAATFRSMQQGGGVQAQPSGHFDEEGNWQAAPATGVIFFGPPGFA